MTDVFEGKSLEDLFQEIHSNTIDKRKTILEFIYKIQKYINSMDDMVMLAPILKDYFKILVENDEHMIKVAAIAQRLVTAQLGVKTDDLGNLLSDEEREQLIENAKQELETALTAIETETKDAITAVGAKNVSAHHES